MARISRKKSEAVNLVAKNPGKIKAALKPWINATDAVVFDPVILDGAPAWVEKAWAEAVKIVMPSNRMPLTGYWDMELLGELMGRLQALSKFFCGEIPIEPELQTELEQVENWIASQPQTAETVGKIKEFTQQFCAAMDTVQEGIPHFMTGAMASSHEDTLKFQKGMSRGLNLKSDDLVSANVFERHTRTVLVLAVHWRFWVKCKSLREIYDILCKAVGEQKLGSFKTFEKLCNKIGLKLRGRGRPRK